MSAFKKVAVLGSGVMGSGLAAQIANAGVSVLLLDMDAAVVRKTLASMQKQKPAPFMSAKAAKLVEAGSFDADLARVAECDWILEVIVENLEIKRGLYQKLEAVRKPGSIVSSNTSGIPLAALMRDMPQRLQQDFAITHFFNPPRYMRLVELVVGPATAATTSARLREFCDVRMGKTVVAAKDTPGFIANRIGGHVMNTALHAALELGLTVEEADAVAGRQIGFPKTGIFALFDLVGIDLMPHLARNMGMMLKPDDAARKYLDIPPIVQRMIERGLTGRKGSGGFYRMKKSAGKKTMQAIDFTTGEYRDLIKPNLESVKAPDAKSLLEHPDRGGLYAWRFLSESLSYAVSLAPEIADDFNAIDDAMRLGYGWNYGPCELLDRIGVDYFTARLESEGRPVPPILQTMKQKGLKSFYRVEGADAQYLDPKGDYRTRAVSADSWMLADIKRKSRRVAGNESATLWDIGDGVACLEFHTKMNAIDDGIVALMVQAREIVSREFAALVIGNDADNFSVGANLTKILHAANLGTWDAIDGQVRGLQDAGAALKYAPFPVVGAPAGMALGGGCEVLLHCNAIQAHAELYAGLVEAGVGLVPGGGGAKELVVRATLNKKRAGGPMPAAGGVFEMISTAKVSTSAMEAMAMGILRPTDGISMNRRRVLADAKARALVMAKDYKPLEPQPVYLPGPSARAALMLVAQNLRLAGKVTDYDMVVTERIARIVSGGDTDITRPVTEADLLRLEREAFMDLVRREPTRARMQFMLENGKPLRN